MKYKNEYITGSRWMQSIRSLCRFAGPNYHGALAHKQKVSGNAFISISNMFTGLILSALLLSGIVTCTDDYNPFMDPSNAIAVLRRNSAIRPGDTITIFTKELMAIAVAAGELIDSVLVVTPNNMFNERNVIYPPFAAPVYSFPLSLSDTGTCAIVITTFRTGGGEVITNVPVYGISPLRQIPIDSKCGEPVQLQTPPVGDSGRLFYHWKFGDAMHVISPRPETLMTFMRPSLSSVGYLWVSDIDGEHRSPSFPFVFAFRDERGPDILYGNTEYQDTIYTGHSSFNFMVTITDQDDPQSIYQARINGQPFELVNIPFYRTIFRDTDTITTPKEIHITAWDVFLNKSERKFWLVYDSTGTHGQPQLEILTPTNDSIIQTRPSSVVSGRLTGTIADTVSITIEVNDSLYPDARVITSKENTDWGWYIRLSTAINTIMVRAYAGAVLIDSQDVTIRYEPTVRDTFPPIFIEIFADGRSTDFFQTTDSSVLLEIVAYDEGSGIEYIGVNGDSMHSDPGNIGYKWQVPVTLTKGKNTFSLVAKDHYGLRTTEEVVLIRNTPPEIYQPPDPPAPLFVGSLYRDRMLVADADGDRTTVTKLRGPIELRVTSDGDIRWEPTVRDTGYHMVVFVYKDSYTRETYVWHITVADTTAVPVPIRFAVSEIIVPKYLQVGLDTMNMVLGIVSGTGKPPFSFSAHRQQNEYIMESNVFTWIPSPHDTGMQRFRFFVSDRYNRADTLAMVVPVVPENRPCSLSVGTQFDTLPDGTIDMTTGTGLDTIRFQIHDKDLPIVEHYQITAMHSHVTAKSEVSSSGDFYIVVDLDTRPVERDSLFVTVEDRGGHRDSMELHFTFIK